MRPKTSGTSIGMQRFFPLILGLSFVWPCLGSFVTRRFRLVIALSSSVLPSNWHFAVMSAAYLIEIVCLAAARDRLGRAFETRRAAPFVVACAACGLAGHLMMIGSPLAGDAWQWATALVVIGLVMTTVYIMGHILAWLIYLTGLRFPVMLIVVGLSNALGYGLQLIFDALPGDIFLYYLVICPVGSCVCWCVYTARADVSHLDRQKKVSLVQSIRELPWDLIGLTVLLIDCEQFFSGMLFTRTESWSTTYLWVSFVASGIVWLVVAAAALSLLGAESLQSSTQIALQSSASFMTMLFSGLVLVYMAALFVMMIFPDADLVIPQRILVGAGTCFRVLLLVLVTRSVCEGASTTIAATMVFVTFILVIPVSRITEAFAALADPGIIAAFDDPARIVPFAAVLLFVVAVGFVVVNTRHARRIVSEASLGAKGDQEDIAGAVVEALAQRGGLSARECDVLELILRGYSAKHAADSLGIAESTVVSHTTHIYRKLDVASKQDLIACAERTSDEIRSA